jgi:WD40 repeat protein
VRHSAAFVAIVAAALTAQGAYPPPGHAAFPGGNGRIVFTGSSGFLYSMNPDGSGIITLRRHDGDVLPVWSPDGGRIAFGDGNDRVLAMSSDGSGVHQVTASGQYATWSPDGTKLVFSNGGLWVIDDDGSNPSQITTDGALPAWSPDGNTIVYSRIDGSGNWTVWRVDADGQNNTQLTTGFGDQWPNWSPDGTRIAFQQQLPGGAIQVATMNPDGSDLQTITSVGNNFMPRWSPDGTKIGFASSRGAGLWTMDPSGTSQARVVKVDLGSFDWQPRHLALHSSRAKVLYPGRLKVTAHLLQYQTTSNATVSIYKIPYGGSETLVGSGSVNASGDFSVTTKVAKRTSFVARWTGDTQHPAGGTSLWVRVAVRAAVSGHFSRFYARSGRYALYHYTGNCTHSGKGCPRYTGTVRPNHAGQRIYFTLQLHISGSWRTALSFSDPIGDNGSTTELFLYRNSSVIGVLARVHCSFKGDADHLGNRSRWSYFKVTN